VSISGSVPATRRYRRLLRRRLRWLTAAVPALALAATALITPAATAARQVPARAATGATAAAVPATARLATRRPAPAAGPLAVALPGLHAASYTVTLITGDRLRLTAAATGRYTVTATPAGQSSPSIHFNALGSATRTRSLYALPDDAASLVSAGQLDRGLFDLTWLAGHGDTGSGARLPVVLQLSGHPAASALAREAAALPGASVTGISAASRTAQISVDSRQATAFWAALTGRTPAASAAGAALASQAGAAGPRLAAGITRVWLAGHETAPASQARALDGQPQYTVTETIQGSSDPARWCGKQVSLCLTGSFYLLGVAGGGADNVYQAIAKSCATASPCTAFHVTYSVPAGVYMASGSAAFFVAERMQFINLVDPQFTVAGDTGITLDVNKAQQVTIDTPQPSESFAATFENYRTAPDGNFSADGSIVFYGYQNFWAIPTGQPVTIGTYHYSSAWMLGAPPVTMTVVAPEHLSLEPTYPLYSNVFPGGPFARFSGRRTMPLAYAGFGSAADFNGLDVHGKLVVIRLDPAVYGCLVEQSQLDNAFQAGAAGVLIDPRLDPSLGGGACMLPVQPKWFSPGGGPAVTNIPFASVPETEAAALESLLTRGSVQITVADSGPSPYLYDLKFYAEGQIPGSLHYTVGNQQLADVSEQFHAATPGLADLQDSIVGLNEYVVAGNYYSFQAPASLHDYVGPVSPDVVHWRWSDNADSTLMAYDVFDQGGGATTEDWFDEPEAPATVTAPADVYQAQPGKWLGDGINTTLCSFCRQGNTFYPFFYRVLAADPRLIYNGVIYAFDPSDIHLYQSSGQEIPQTLLDGYYVTYQLPAQEATYRLATAYNDTYTDWQFTSAGSAADETPYGYRCLGTAFGVSTAPCRADPLILLRYDAFTGLTNTVTAAGTRNLQVTAYYQAPASPRAITSLKLWTSTDGGATWQHATITGHGGTYIATYRVPPLAATSGTVSIKVEASDAAGDTVSQVIYNAYNLSAAR